MFRSRHTARRGYADGNDSPYCFNFLTQVCCRDTCKGVRQCECEICVVKLRERWGRAPRDRLSGAGSKPLQAAAVKSRGGERWSESSRKDLEPVSIRETNESEPFEDAS